MRLAAEHINEGVECGVLTLTMLFLTKSHLQQVLSRSIDKIFEEAQFYGTLNLSYRHLRTLPITSNKFDLADTVYVGE